MVANWVVAALALGEGAHAPAGEEPRSEQVLRNRLCLRLVDDPAPEEMAVVRRQRVHLLALAVEREREILAVLDPEVAVEATPQVGGLPLELVRKRRVLPEETRQPRAAQLRVIGVPLQLAGRAREARDPTVAVRDRVPRILPALVLEPRLLVPALVPEVAAAADQVPVLVDPAQGRARFGFELADEPPVAAPALVLVEQHAVQRRRVSGAVVRGVRPLLERRQLPVAHLVEDPAGILVAEVVDPAALPGAEHAQCGGGELGRERQRLQAREDAVAPEHGHEPRQAGGRQAPPLHHGR